MPNHPPTTPPRAKRTASAHTRVQSLAQSQSHQPGFHSTPTGPLIQTPHFPPYRPSRDDADDHNPQNDHDDPESPLHTLSFSPSKARILAHQSQQLNQLTTWLSSLLTPVPSGSSSSSSVTDTSTTTTSTAAAAAAAAAAQLLNRFTQLHRSLTVSSPDTAAALTEYLQALMSRNQLADEARRVLAEAQAEEVSTSTSTSTSANTSAAVEGMSSSTNPALDLLDTLSSSLTDAARDALDALAHSAVLLGSIPDHDLSSDRGTAGTVMATLGAALGRHTRRAQQAETRVEELTALQRGLAGRLADARARGDRFERERRGAEAEAEEVMRPRTAQWGRDTKQINLKMQEYRDRIAVLERSRPGVEMDGGLVRVEDVVEMQERVDRRREKVEMLEERLKVLHGLPPDLEASRHEVKRARTDLERLKARREELFGLLAERR